MRRVISALSLAVMLGSTAQAGEAVDGNVVEFHVMTVAMPARLPGACIVSAIVGKVWQGSAYRAGQPIALNVPCAEYGLVPANTWADGFTPVNARTLQPSVRGIARLSDSGELLWRDTSLRQYGPWGAVAGYRVLDARMIPIPVRAS